MGIIGKLINKILDTEIPGTKKNNPITKEDFVASIGIKLSSEDQEEENKKYKEIAEATIESVKQSGFFKPEYFPKISKMIQEKALPGCHWHDPFSYEDCLSLEEKKTIGLNTRQKYSREMVETLTELGLRHENPKRILEILYYRNYHKICGKYELIRLRRVGIDTVEILDCNDERDCQAIKKFKKVWPIDQVPELPIPGCNAEYCRCCYTAYFSDLE
ncbi:hypothetical protein AGMMS4952_10950 [Spirochaetia bacterium]|nr:hypothetical protein AGMMS4952_10950 [Spirochaetia bacterium]